jgi:hypothetical protein
MLPLFFYDSSVYRNYGNKTLRRTFSASAFAIAMVVMGSDLAWKYQ